MSEGNVFAEICVAAERAVPASQRNIWILCAVGAPIGVSAPAGAATPKQTMYCLRSADRALASHSKLHQHVLIGVIRPGVFQRRLQCHETDAGHDQKQCEHDHQLKQTEAGERRFREASGLATNLFCAHSFIARSSLHSPQRRNACHSCRERKSPALEDCLRHSHRRISSRRGQNTEVPWPRNVPELS